MFPTPEYTERFEYLKKRYGEPIGEGRHRVVFRDKNTVIKLPKSESGEIANTYESVSWQDDPEHLARAWVDRRLSKKLKITIARMEYVEHRGWSENPDWTWGIDCGQVGHTKDGRLVAYDWEHVQ